MFKKDTIKNFIIGFITYFVLSIILDLFGVNTTIIKSIIVIIILIIYFIIQSQKKNNKS
ncbi:hypothetical protein [Senegalia massiliensis]|uniref:hypothetical protein n=1 Tax=Senegalia massiliensis TaxID=1720316 RepID=UPI0013EF4B9C|nr:hypothetical protein [Senegalia massiliensis]